MCGMVVHVIDIKSRSEVIKMGKSCATINHSLQYQVSMLKL